MSIPWASGRNTAGSRAARGLAARRRIPALIPARIAAMLAIPAVAAGAVAGAAAAPAGRPAAPAAVHRVLTLDAARVQDLTSRRAARRSGTPVGAGGPAAGQSPRQIARGMLRSFGWGTWEFRSLDKLWNRESGWQVHADNPYSGAYGIPQAVPGSKMASAGPRWRTSARVQIRWGLGYIKVVYGSPWHAWQHELGTGWYGHRGKT